MRIPGWRVRLLTSLALLLLATAAGHFLVEITGLGSLGLRYCGVVGLKSGRDPQEPGGWVLPR